MELEKSIFLINQWVLNELLLLQNKHHSLLKEERVEIGLATLELIKFIQQTLSGSYLELIKLFPEPWNDLTVKTLAFVFQQSLLLLHPITPFVTNYLYKKIFELEIYDSLGFKSAQLLLSKESVTEIWKVDCLLSMLRVIRDLRKEGEVKSFHFQFSAEWQNKDVEFNWNFFLEKMVGFSVVILEEGKEGGFSFSVSRSLFPFGVLWCNKEEFLFIVDGAGTKELKKCLAKCKLEYERCCQLLENVGFLAKARFSLIEREKKKRNYYLEEKEKLEKKIAAAELKGK